VMVDPCNWQPRGHEKLLPPLSLNDLLLASKEV
jgi:hypothetical protein